MSVGLRNINRCGKTVCFGTLFRLLAKITHQGEEIRFKSRSSHPITLGCQFFRGWAQLIPRIRYRVQIYNLKCMRSVTNCCRPVRNSTKWCNLDKSCRHIIWFDPTTVYETIGCIRDDLVEEESRTHSELPNRPRSRFIRGLWVCSPISPLILPPTRDPNGVLSAEGLTESERG